MLTIYKHNLARLDFILQVLTSIYFAFSETLLRASSSTALLPACLPRSAYNNELLFEEALSISNIGLNIGIF